MEKRRKRKQYDLEYKRKIVEEFLSGSSSAQEIADREDISTGQIYKWRIQLENRARSARIDEIQADNPQLTFEQARRIRELEEELEDYQKKVAQLTLENDLLKKLQPNSPYAKKSSGYIEIKNTLARSKRRAK